MLTDIRYALRLMWKTPIDMSNLTSAEADSHAVDGSMRLMGIGGLFSFSGIYRSKKLGTYRMYATDFKKAVVLRLGDKTVLVTPEDPEGLVRAVRTTAV